MNVEKNKKTNEILTNPVCIWCGKRRFSHSEHSERCGFYSFQDGTGLNVLCLKEAIEELKKILKR